MIVVGIISVPEKKTKIYKRYFKPASIKEKIGTQYLVAELSVSGEQLSSLNERRISKIIGYAAKILKREGATHIILTKECKDSLLYANALDGFENEKTRKIPSHKIFDAFRYISDKNVSFKGNRRLLITDSDLSYVDYDFVEKLCSGVKYITLRTNKTESALYISEKLFSEYGIIIQITKDDVIRRSFYEIDFDRRIVRGGDFIIDGAEFVSGVTEYSLDADEEAYCFSDENKLKIKNWFSGKNKLKIS